jgi:hypothetical protein
MAFEHPGGGALTYFPCRYGNSKLLFRGPQRALDRPYCAVLGGTASYGKFVPFPYPALVEAATGTPVVNLGCVNAGPDVYLNDPEILAIAGRAEVTVLQVLGATNLTNRFYAVHPRRNDRFLWAEPLLRSMYRDVDFTEFNFTRHMLLSLQAAGQERFGLVVEELRSAWVARMTALVTAVSGPVVLLWWSDRPPPPSGSAPDLNRDPLLVDRDMLSAILALADDYVEVVTSAEARAQGVDGMAFAPLDRPAASLVPGPAAHREAAAALLPSLTPLL